MILNLFYTCGLKLFVMRCMVNYTLNTDQTFFLRAKEPNFLILMNIALNADRFWFLRIDHVYHLLDLRIDNQVALVNLVALRTLYALVFILVFEGLAEALCTYYVFAPKNHRLPILVIKRKVAFFAANLSYV